MIRTAALALLAMWVLYGCAATPQRSAVHLVHPPHMHSTTPFLLRHPLAERATVARSAAPAGGVVRVATGGSDVPGCGTGAPCATINYAIEIAQAAGGAPGNIVELDAGVTYGQQIIVNGPPMVWVEANGGVATLTPTVCDSAYSPSTVVAVFTQLALWNITVSDDCPGGFGDLLVQQGWVGLGDGVTLTSDPGHPLSNLIEPEEGGYVEIANPVTLNGQDAQEGIAIGNIGNVVFDNPGGALTGNAHFPYEFAWVTNGGQLNVQSAAFAGSALTADHPSVAGIGGAITFFQNATDPIPGGATAFLGGQVACGLGSWVNC